MPVHDRSRVFAGAFHDFHHVWIGELRNALNSGVLPPDYYAMAEQVAGPTVPDVLTLQTANGFEDQWSVEPISPERRLWRSPRLESSSASALTKRPTPAGSATSSSITIVTTGSSP